MSFWKKEWKGLPDPPKVDKPREPIQLECLFSEGKEHLWGQWHPVEVINNMAYNVVLYTTTISRFQTRYCERCFIAQMTEVLTANAYIKE